MYDIHVVFICMTLFKINLIIIDKVFHMQDIKWLIFWNRKANIGLYIISNPLTSFSYILVTQLERLFNFEQYDR